MRFRAFILIAILLAAASGCSAVPDIRSQQRIHNPFPQLHRVAVLPFVNQSQEPTLDTTAVTLAYHNELQKLPGFEVKPVGVVKAQLEALQLELNGGTDFQALAQHLDVDVIVLGSVTEYTPYYPPRLGMRVHWYAANPGFHPIPPGYGLPWGTAEEEYIPDRLVHEAEFALARAQLKTQTPDYVKAPMPKPRRRAADPMPDESLNGVPADPGNADEADGEMPGDMRNTRRQGGAISVSHSRDLAVTGMTAVGSGVAHNPHDPLTFAGPPPYPEPAPLPADWPDPRGLIPMGPSPQRPELLPQAEPIITHTRLYDGNDDEFTQQVAEYFYFRDDARFGGWQAYLQRSEDFIRVCCYLHVTETLAARGGAGKSRVVWRWPIGRYER